MVRSLLVIALVFASGCGDSVAHESGTSTATGASDSASTTGGGASTASETSETTASPTSGTTADTSASASASSTSGPAMKCYESSIVTSVAELTAEKLKGHDCITGDVWISEGTGPDLWFLSGIRWIGGDLEIWGTEPHSLVSLHGLEKLESVGGKLYLGETPNLADASALAGLVSVGGDFEFLDAPQLTALDLGALTTLQGGLRVSAPLASLDVTKLTSLPGDLVLENTDLTTLAGLANVTSIEGLRLYHNAQLVDLTGLAALTQMGGRLEIQNNAALVSLDGLAGVATISLHIRNNPELTSLAPLAGVTVQSVLAITGNAALPSLPPLKGEVGHLEIGSNTALTSLAGLEGVTVTGTLDIRFNDALIDLKGLGGVADALQRIEIRENAGLQALDGLPGPVVVDDVSIFDNPQLQSLDPLKSLQSAVRLGIRDNPKLTTIAPLQDGALVEVLEVYDVSGNALLPSCEAKALYDSLQPPPQDFCYDNMVDMCSGLGGCVVVPPP